MAVLKLGLADKGKKPGDPKAFLGAFHESTMQQAKFRGEKDNQWVSIAEVPGSGVRDLQSKLQKTGFFPYGAIDGIFGYRTQSAVRLFQEYVRTTGGDPGIGKPDGIVGNMTTTRLDAWAKQGKKSDWATTSAANPTPAYRNWMSLLAKLKSHYGDSPSDVLRLVDAYRGKTDTVGVANWDLSTDHPHLIGVRRGTDAAWKERINNDMFVLLVNGMAFTFFGSTDPNPGVVERKDQPFLVPAQHRYRFGWHKMSTQRAYRCFRPATQGVLVVRDRAVGGTTDVLDAGDLAAGVDKKPNTTINIHWSGRHTASWSAGCQVISGGGYINHKDQLIDCWDFAAPTYKYLDKMTRGAYNVFLDLATTFSKNTKVKGGDVLHYTLIEEKELAREPAIGASAVKNTLGRGLELLAKHDANLAGQYKGKLS